MHQLKLVTGVCLLLVLGAISLWILQSYIADSARLYHAWASFHPSLPAWAIVAWISLGCLLTPGFQVLGAATWVLIKRPFVHSFLAVLVLGAWFFVHLAISTNTIFYFPIWMTYQVALMGLVLYIFQKTSNQRPDRTHEDS